MVIEMTTDLFYLRDLNMLTKVTKNEGINDIKFIIKF